MNDGKIIACTVLATNYNYLSVMKDSTAYLVDKKFINRYTLYSSQHSLLIKNMDYDHSLNNPKYADQGHLVTYLKYKSPLASAGNSLVATGLMIIIGGVLTGAGVASDKPGLSYTGAAAGGLSLIPLIIAGAKLVESGNRHEKYKFLR